MAGCGTSGPAQPDAGADISPPLDATSDVFAEAGVDAGADANADAGETPGVFVAVGYGGRRMRSTNDGLTWIDNQSLEPNGGDDQDLLRTVTFGNGGFVAAGWQTLTSPDGQTWAPLPATKQNWFGSLVWSGAQYVAVGGYGMRLTSPDGVTWSDHSIDTVAAHPHGCLVFTSTAYVACNDNGARSRSPDGITWTYAAGATTVPSSGLAFGNGVLVGIGGASVVVSTDDGKTWTSTATLSASGGGLVFAQGHFTYLAPKFVFTSTGGTTWTSNPSPNAQIAALAYGHGTYVAVRGHSFQRSTDGINWNAPVADTELDNALEWVTFGP